VRDRFTYTTRRASVSTRGAQGRGDSFEPSISADGRFVAFASLAPNLIAGDTKNSWDVFVRDRVAHTTHRVTRGGQSYDGPPMSPSISPDGRFVAFASDASNLVRGDTNQVSDVFVRDRMARTTRRVSVSTSGAQGNGVSLSPAISAGGHIVVFDSDASNLVTPTARATCSCATGSARDSVHHRAESAFAAPGTARRPDRGDITAVSSGPSHPARDRRRGGDGHVRGYSVKTELVALDVLHHQARLVLLIGGQQPHAYRAERDQSCAFGLECGEALITHKPGADADVQMQPVLDDLAFRNALEEQSRTHP
jgi:Tol biopolymer transport system component